MQFAIGAGGCTGRAKLIAELRFLALPSEGGGWGRESVECEFWGIICKGCVLLSCFQGVIEGDNMDISVREGAKMFQRFIELIIRRIGISNVKLK